MTAAAIILAAGASTRLGQAKQLILLHDETLLDRMIRIAREADCSPIIVILGASAHHVQQHCRLAGVTTLINEQWREGMASSLRRGVDSLLNEDAVIVLPCDMPAITAEHLRALAATGDLTASRYGERNGIPAFFPKAFFPRLQVLQGDQGARLLLTAARHLDLPEGELDLDTTEDLAAFRARV